MPLDRYTKLVLTVIAVCLVWLSVGGPALITPVSAQADRQSVYIAGWVGADGKVRQLGPWSPTGTTDWLPVWVGNR
jgi:hypothetical protein